MTFDPFLLDEGDVTAGNVQINGPRRVGGTAFATVLLCSCSKHVPTDLPTRVPDSMKTIEDITCT